MNSGRPIWLAVGGRICLFIVVLIIAGACDRSPNEANTATEECPEEPISAEGRKLDLTEEQQEYLQRMTQARLGVPPEISLVAEYAAGLRSGDFSTEGTGRAAFYLPYNLWALMCLGEVSPPYLVELLSDDTLTPYQYVDEQFRFYPVGYGMDLSRIEVERTATIGDMADYALRRLYGVRDVGYRSYSEAGQRRSAISQWRHITESPPPAPPEYEYRLLETEEGVRLVWQEVSALSD
jgi:hypothetical protein